MLEEIKGKGFFIDQSDNYWPWHKRLAHLNVDNIIKINQTEFVQRMQKILKPINRLCGSYQHGKDVREKFKEKVFNSTSHPLEIVHIYLCGPARTQTLQGERYFMLFIDDYSIMTWVTFLKNKTKAFKKFKLFKPKV